MEKILLLNEENDWTNSLLWVNIIINKINEYFINPKDNINNININGKWGIGKTTIAYNIIEISKKEKIKAKSFSLWEYEIDDN